MDIGTVDESQPVGARCCVQIRGVLCGRPAEHEATEDRLKAAAAFKRSPRNGKLTWDASLSLIVSKKRWVCGEHAFDLCQPCLKPAFYVASKNQSVDRRDFINAVVKVCEKVTPAPEALPSKRSRRHTTGELPQHIPQAAELPTPTVPLDEKQLMLWGLFVRVIPFITFPCFFFTYLVTAFRHVLSLNGKSIGGQVWHGDTYGEDVRNWSCCLYAIGSKATHIALTGGAINLAATVATTDIFEAFLSEDADAALMHGPTYMATPLACAAANASLDLFETEPRLQQVAAIEAQLKRELAPLADLPGIADVRVKGAIGAVEVENLHDLDWLKGQFVDAGIWLRPFGNVIYTMPPFTVTPAELSNITGAMAEIIPRWAARAGENRGT